MSARYFDLIREMKLNTYNHRLRLVESAQERGIKPTARLFSTTVPTVRKWLRRFQQHGPSGLTERSRARHHQPHQTPPAVEAQLLALRKTLPTFGARRLIREFDLPVGHDALERIWREGANLTCSHQRWEICLFGFLPMLQFSEQCVERLLDHLSLAVVLWAAKHPDREVSVEVSGD